jgi:hypothetical protein
LIGAFWCLLALPAAATDVDLMGVEIEGVRLGMSLNEAVTALENRGYKRTSKRSLQKRDAQGMYYAGLKLNRGGEVIYVGVAHRVEQGFDADALRDGWIKQWGQPDSRQGNAGHDWTLGYKSEDAVLEASATMAAGAGSPSQVLIRLTAQHQVLAARRGHEVSAKICAAIKDKPVSLLNVNDRQHLMECVRTGQLRICAP